QSEDGIRARNVTGVQTCALPIFLLELSQTFDLDVDPFGVVTELPRCGGSGELLLLPDLAAPLPQGRRCPRPHDHEGPTGRGLHVAPRGTSRRSGQRRATNPGR